jgi:hypothetical protein
MRRGEQAVLPTPALALLDVPGTSLTIQSAIAAVDDGDEAVAAGTSAGDANSRGRAITAHDSARDDLAAAAATTSGGRTLAAHASLGDKPRLRYDGAVLPLSVLEFGL